MMRRIKLFLLVIALLLLSTVSVLAEDSFFTNEETGYQALIDDGAELVSEAEEQAILEAMKPVTKHGNVMFVTTTEPYESTASYAKDLYHKTFRTRSGTLFLIDTYNHYIYLFSDGKINQTVDRQYALTLTDNAYQYASEGDFAQAAIKVFQQEYELLEKGRILQPMKIISTLLIAIICGLLFNFIYLVINRKPMTVTDRNGEIYKPDGLSANFSLGQYTAPAPQGEPRVVPTRAATVQQADPQPEIVQPQERFVQLQAASREELENLDFLPEDEVDSPVVILREPAPTRTSQESNPQRHRPRITTYEPRENPFAEPQPEPSYNLARDQNRGWEIAGKIGLGILRFAFDIVFELLLGGGGGGSSSGGGSRSSSSSGYSSGSGGGHRY